MLSPLLTEQVRDGWPLPPLIFNSFQEQQILRLGPFPFLLGFVEVIEPMLSTLLGRFIIFSSSFEEDSLGDVIPLAQLAIPEWKASYLTA